MQTADFLVGWASQLGDRGVTPNNTLYFAARRLVRFIGGKPTYVYGSDTYKLTTSPKTVVTGNNFVVEVEAVRRGLVRVTDIGASTDIDFAGTVVLEEYVDDTALFHDGATVAPVVNMAPASAARLSRSVVVTQR
jgi:hypothetical protein